MGKKREIIERYDGLDSTIKKPQNGKGLWSLPEDVIGKTDHTLRKFVIFYFDSDEDYQLVLDKLTNTKIRTRKIPEMNTKALVELLRKV